VAQCVLVDGSGALVADATPVESCTGFVIGTAAEFANGQNVVFPPLTVDQGADIGWSIFFCWTLVYLARMFIRAFGGFAPETEQGE
jgi:hypothetical protein